VNTTGLNPCEKVDKSNKTLKRAVRILYEKLKKRKQQEQGAASVSGP
jgi:hypothetical protein